MAKVTTCDVCGRIIAEDFNVVCVNIYTPSDSKPGHPWDELMKHRDLCIPCAEKILKDLDIFKEE